RDFLLANRIPVGSDYTRGGEITSSVAAHFAAAPPDEYLVNSTDLHNYNTRSTGIGGPSVRDGKLYAPDVPGLGVEPDFEALGDPVLEMRA
ncbi:MAG: mandelate racemase, partial [Boseongicola sp.]|nr:mandelate racemase [Boseongicola sp.]